MKISNPELKIIRFSADDVIATSIFYIRTSDITADSKMWNNIPDNALDSDYVRFNGTMMPLENDDWGIFNPSDFAAYREEDVNWAKDQQIAGVYDAYLPDDNWQFHTKGASYADLYGNQ